MQLHLCTHTCTQLPVNDVAALFKSPYVSRLRQNLDNRIEGSFQERKVRYENLQERGRDRGKWRIAFLIPSAVNKRFISNYGSLVGQNGGRVSGA